MSELSVIVPMHNAEAFVPGCLATIRRNVSDGMRFIVVDDYSTDATPRLLEAAARVSPYITVVRNDANLGVAASRNIAQALVKTRYVSYLDVDDWYAPGYLSALERAIAELEVDFVRTDHIRVDGIERVRVRAPEQRRNEALPAIDGIGKPGRRAMMDYPFLWAGIYDTQRIAPELFTFDESLRTAADRPWFFRLHLNARDTAVVDLDGYFYRKSANASSLTQAGNAQTLHFLDASWRVHDIAVADGRADIVDKACYAAMRMVHFHVMRRARLSDELRRELYRRSAQLIRAYPEDTRDRALATFPMDQRLLIRRIMTREAA